MDIDNISVADATAIAAVLGNPEGLQVTPPHQIVRTEGEGDAAHEVVEDVPGRLEVSDDLADAAAAAWADIDATRVAAARSLAMAAILSAIDAAGASVLAGYPGAERESWPQKEAAARAVLAGTASATDAALLAAETALTGESQADLAATIVASADAFRVISATLSGARRSALSVIDVASTVADIEAARDTALGTISAVLAG